MAFWQENFAFIKVSNNGTVSRNCGVRKNEKSVMVFI
jgi:hypothetical protein